MTGKAAGSPAHWRYAGDGELPGANGTGPTQRDFGRATLARSAALSEQCPLPYMMRN
jgi:hypothetical protein